MTKAFQCAIFVETTTKKNNKIMMKEMIRKVMEWCKLWNGETATAKQADPSSDKREKEQAADNREVQDRLENSTCGNTMSSVSTC